MTKIEAKHHGPGLKLYVMIFLSLMFFTFLTVYVSSIDLGGIWNNIIMLAIASLKAFLVVAFFMHVYYEKHLIWAGAAIGFIFLIFLLGFTLADYQTRDWFQSIYQVYLP